MSMIECIPLRVSVGGYKCEWVRMGECVGLREGMALCIGGYGWVWLGVDGYGRVSGWQVGVGR